MTNTLLTKSGTVNLKPLILPDEFNVFDIPRRGYDFNRGDRRFNDQRRAIAFAYVEATRTGVRQIIRRDSTPDFVEGTFWLVQAIGS